MRLVRRMRVFRQATQSCFPQARPDAVFAKMSEADVRDPARLPADVHQRQLDRLHRFGASYCHGAYIDGELASFAWLLPHDVMPRDTPCLLSGRQGEAEFTAAETLPQYRGRGLYGFVLINEFSVARAQGIHTVLFKTYPENKAALRSFEKIGAQYVGTTYFLHVPGMGSALVWPRQFK